MDSTIRWAREDNGFSGNTSQNVKVEPGASAANATYTLNRDYPDIVGEPSIDILRSFTNLVDLDDGLGPVSTAANGDTTFYKFDVSSALSGSLDYVQLVAHTRANSGTLIDDGFQTYGRLTTTANMPRTGSAVFNGGTRGFYYDGAKTFATASDITMNVDFAAMTATGSTSNFRMADPATGAAAVGAPTFSFRFTAEVYSPLPFFEGDAVLTSSDPSMMNRLGAVKGAFFGPAGRSPEEAGLVYTFVPGALLLHGGAALGRAP
jgi:hypothetical protein